MFAIMLGYFVGFKLSTRLCKVAHSFVIVVCVIRDQQCLQDCKNSRHSCRVNMYGIVNLTIGLVCKRIRDYISQRLNEGDFVGIKLRQIAVRELDDIEKRLDGLLQKDLGSSLSFFKEGVTRVYTSLQTPGESCEKSSTSQAHTEDDEPEGATAMTVKRVEGDAIDTVLDLRQFIGNLRIESEKRYQSAEKSFEEAKSLATQAFINTALSTEDRVMAGKIRIASKILGCLDDPEAAVRDCLLYLKELQDLPAVQAMFTVWQQSKKRFTSRFRARRTESIDTVESIQAINALLFDITLQYTNTKMAAFNWPTVNIGKAIHHPILHNEEIMTELRICRYTKQVPWIWGFQSESVQGNRAVTSTGEILSNAWSRKDDQHGIEIIKRNGKCSMFCTVSSDNHGEIGNKICCFAVDENDNVYVVIEIYSRDKYVTTQYKLLTFDKNGKEIADRALGIIKFLWSPQMTVTKDGKLVIYCDAIRSMYICDSTNAKKDYKFPLPLKDVRPDDIDKLSFTISDQNEIICTYLKSSDAKAFVMLIITMDGKLKHDLDVPKIITSRQQSVSVVFNHVNKTILVSVCHLEREISLLTFSNTGELLYKFKIPGWSLHQLTSHPNGPIALVGEVRVMMLQM